LTPDSISNLAIGDDQIVTVDVEVPDDQELGDYSGNITIYEGNTPRATADLDLTVELGNHLVIKKVRFTGERDSDTAKKDDDELKWDDDEEPRPGETITIEVEVENDFEDNIEIEDIEIEVRNDNDLDWDEDESVSDLDDGEEDTATFELEIDQDVDDDTYDIEIEVTGEDEDGNTHGETWTIELEVKKLDDDLRITDTRLIPSSLTCEDKNVRLEITIDNVGEDDQSRAVLLAENSQLGIEEIIRSIEVDEGEDVTRTMLLSLDELEAAGSYPILISVFTSGDKDDLTDVATVQLPVISCDTTDDEAEEEEEEGEEEDIEVVTPTPTVTGSFVASTSGEPSKQFIDTTSDLYMGLLIGIVVLLAVLVVVAATAVFGKKR
ncbi:hypothetical protein GF367_01365, partial [Candidatus Woesearchaeota archaeon]|nr:hypothetical protein [Candidatus Woesearchaeota archaeon]